MKRILDRIKRWWNGTPVPDRADRAYSISGWTRGADGVYHYSSGHGYAIYQLGRTWYRDTPISGPDGGVELQAVPYPSLHAAIKGERPEQKPETLFEDPVVTAGVDVQRDGAEVGLSIDGQAVEDLLAEGPLAPCPHGERVGLCSQCNED